MLPAVSSYCQMWFEKIISGYSIWFLISYSFFSFLFFCIVLTDKFILCLQYLLITKQHQICFASNLQDKMKIAF